MCTLSILFSDLYSFEWAAVVSGREWRAFEWLVRLGISCVPHCSQGLFFYALCVVAILVKEQVGYFPFFVFDEFDFGVDVFREEHGFGLGIDFEIALAGCSGNQLIALQPYV